ncbi:MAG: phosphate signaling complex protein PhoU, partial [Mucinivorans sp.]
HTDLEIKTLKNHHIEMWNLVQTQVAGAFDALRTGDKDRAREILARERVVNAQELVVDHHCENFIALFAPVAVDLRFVISLLKITNNLERIGDFAESIALFVLYKQNGALDEQLFRDLELQKMMDTATQMLAKAREALVAENSAMACQVLAMDDTIDQINTQAVDTLAAWIASHIEQTTQTLNLHAVVRRIERIGDRASNIAEDTVFYVDAKELRHSHPAGDEYSNAK